MVNPVPKRTLKSIKHSLIVFQLVQILLEVGKIDNEEERLLYRSNESLVKQQRNYYKQFVPFQ